jgi:hypothetical protein
MTERFTLLTELGRGGMGVVWEARDEETGQIVALKLLRETYAEDPDYVVRFERELALAKRIHSHNVVQVLGYGVRDGIPYLALEYVDGPSLRERLASHGPYSWPEARAVLAQILQGLVEAHAAGVIHRDLKPSNVLIGSDGVAKIADFGIAKGLDLTRVTGTSTLLGTPAYLPPEGPDDQRSDLYSLGTIAYEMLSGAPPFEGRTYQEVILRHIREAPDLTKLAPEARPVVGWLLAKNPADRPQSAAEAARAIAASTVPKSAAKARRGESDSRRGKPAATTPGPVRVRSRRSSVLRAGCFISFMGVVVVAAIGGTWLGMTLTAPSAPPATGQLAAPMSAMATPTADLPRLTPTGSMTMARQGQTATLLPDGRVLIAGGTDGVSITDSAELYDPATGAFSQTGSMTGPREGHTATLLSNGRVLIAGGLFGTGPTTPDVLASAELYDPASGSFTATGRMTVARLGHSATLLADGRVLLDGGSNSLGSATRSAEIYDPTTGGFTPTGSMLTARRDSSATLLGNGQVLVAGGTSNEVLSDAELYDVASGTFHATGSMVVPRAQATATLLVDGRVLISGGSNGVTNLASAEVFDTRSGSFSLTGAMTVARAGHAAVMMQDGRVLMVGGDGGAVSSTEVYYPASATFRLTGSMSVDRGSGFSSVQLLNGSVLTSGGGVGSAILASAELYTP